MPGQSYKGRFERPRAGKAPSARQKHPWGNVKDRDEKTLGIRLPTFARTKTVGERPESRIPKIKERERERVNIREKFFHNLRLELLGKNLYIASGCRFSLR